MQNARASSLGVAHNVRVDPISGGLLADVPLKIPSARGGSGPQFQLDYRSGVSNSVFGVGWSLSGLLSITIDSSEGLPRYDGHDKFAFTATGALVPYAADPSPDAPDRWEDRGTHRVRRFRARAERGYQRVEQWIDKATQRVHWVTFDARGTVTVFGADGSGLSRIADPEDAARVFQWLPDIQFDTQGNAIRFDYLAEDVSGVDLVNASVGEGVRAGIAPAQRHLKRVRWGNTVPVTSNAADPPEQSWSFELVFDYGDHDPANPRPTADRLWSTRPDPFSTCTPGFELRTYRLCRRILLFHRFTEIGPGARLAGFYELQHDLKPDGSTLTWLRYVGVRQDAGVQTSRAQPPLTFTYTTPRVAEGFRAAPATTLDTLPHGLDAPRFRWLDLYGEGLPGVLVEERDAWYYKRNQGNGRFSRDLLVTERPAYRLADVHMQDFDGDGNPNLTVVGSRQAGYYEFDRATEQWQGFHPFRSIPHLDAQSSRTQWLDLDGDGLAELLLGDADRLTWFRSLGKEGFDTGIELPSPEPLERGIAAPLRDQPGLRYFFTDMNGDGLVDQVLVRNGLVAYWPNLGRGRFGAPLLLDGAPWFASEAEFNPARLMFVDLDGSGTADILYIGDGELTYWTNACGNRLLPGRTLKGLPRIDNVASARVLDFLGDGTPCLVWSTPLPGGVASLRYLPLTDGIRAGLLTETNNSIGLVRRVAYGTSATHYLRDLASGVPWHTRLATHVTVVERLDTVDEIGGARLVSRFAYHDGCFNGRDRRFVGFGCVESFDTEEAPSSDPLAPLTTGSCTRTFLHLGSDGAPSLARAWNADAGAPTLPGYLFEGTTPLAEADILDGLATVAGQIVRQEVFSVSPTGQRAPNPIRVDQSGFLLRPLQRAGGDRRASFAAILREQISAVYEQVPNDPRITHHAALDTDAYGGTTLTCAIAYPRRSTIPAADAEQRRLRASAERMRAIHIDTATEYQPLVGFEQESFDLPGIAAPATGIYSWEGLRTIVTGALTAPEPHDAVAIPAGSSQRKSWSRTFYYTADGSAVAAFGSASMPIRVHHVEEAAFSTTFATAVYGGLVDAVRMRDEGLYRSDSGHWWRIGERFDYGGAPQFYRVEGVTRPNGVTTTFAYDSTSLHVVETMDAGGNHVRMTYDYFALAPARSVDENNNISETAYDPLGNVIVATHQGEVLDEAGVARRYGFDRLGDLTMAISASPETVLANPEAHLQTAAHATVYDLDRWTSGEPPIVVEIARETLAHDGTGAAPAGSRVLVSVKHLDGFGRTLQQKRRVDPGDAIARAGDGSLLLDGAGNPDIRPAAERWLVSGHTVFNARQEPARTYEPFFSTTWRFEPDAELARFGVVHTFFYDAAGRQVRHDHPNGTHERAEFGAWSRRTFDTNDTVDDSAYRLERELLLPADPQRLALDRARAHAGTPVIVHLDPLGQEIVQSEASGDGQERTLRTTYTADGTVRSVRDPRGVESMSFTRDMLGRELRTRSADAGEELVFMDALDRPLESWKGNGLHLVRQFDALDRLMTVDADGLPGLNRRVQEITYGESPEVSDAARRNLRGRAFRIRDDSGVRTMVRNTPAGDPLEATRRVTANPETLPDWRVPLTVALLPDVFVLRFRYDALRRPIQHVLADGAIVNYVFSLTGGVQRATISTDDGLLSNQVIFDGADFNARGQRTRVSLGNGVGVSHTFERDTWRTSGILTRRSSDSAVLQDIQYTYDPAGNVIRSLDRSHEPGAASPFITNVIVPAERRFRYDAFYRLREATGRIHRAVTPTDHRMDPPIAGTFKGARRLSFNDGGQLERYTELFTYDLSGNLTQLRHQGPTVNWTQDFWISATSNRSLPALDASGIPVTNPESHFDQAGNCIRLPHLRRMDWDYAGMPARAVIIDRSASGQPDDDELYLHDSDGTRVRKVRRRMVNGGAVETTDVLYLDGCEIRRIERSGARLLERRTTHVHDQFNRIATVHRWTVDTNSRETTDTTLARVHYHLSDHLGSATLQLDETGQVIAYEEYLPYGNTAFLAGDNVREIETHAYRYAGKERDDATGLYYFGHRYYAPWLGRWMSPDPAGPIDDLNLYQYAQNNPISNFDPDGLQTRGREIPVTGSTPPDVEAAFARLPPAEQERLRGLMRSGNFAWFCDGGTRQFHFGTRAEIDRRVEAMLASGRNVGNLVPPSPEGGTEGRDGEGGRRGSRRRRRDSDGRTRRGGGRGSRGGGGRRGGRRGRARTGGAAPSDGTGGTARGAGGTPADSTGTGRASDSGGTSVSPGDGAPADAPPGSGGAGGEGGTGGSGTSGTGTGANAGSTGTGAGGGGEDESPTALGTGDAGEGTGGGTGTGTGSGAGDQPGESDAMGSGGDGNGGNGAGGTGAGDGSGSGAGTSLGRPGGRPGGDPAGTAGGSPTGQAGGDLSGGSTGSPNGTSGTGATSGTPGTGTSTASDHGPPGEGSGTGGGGTRRGTGAGGRGEEPGGERGGGARTRPTVMDRIVRVAGYWHLEFNGDPNGRSGGIPGGMGSFNLGAFGQALFVALTVVDIALTIASFGGLAGIKAGIRVAISAARRVLSSAGRRIAAAWARRRAMREALRVTTSRVVRTFSVRSAATRAGSLLREWFFFRRDLGGVTTHTLTRFGVFARSSIQNLDWAAGRVIGGIDTAVHEGFHWLMSKVPFFRSHQWWSVRGQPIGAVVNWAEETVAYALGHASVLRVHGVLAAPIEAFGSVFANYGGKAEGRRAVAWAIGELALIGGGIATYFGLRDRQPAEATAP